MALDDVIFLSFIGYINRFTFSDPLKLNCV